MATINYDTRQKIIAQALQELQFARTYKQGKVKNWKEVEREDHDADEKNPHSYSFVKYERAK